MKNLTGKVIVNIGASGGIGSVVSETAANAGATLVLVARTESKLLDLQKKIGGKTFVIPADTAVPEEAQKVFDLVLKQFGRIDAVILTAGTWHKLGLESSFEEAVKQAKNDMGPLVFAAYYSAFLAAKLFAKEGRGLIVNVSSHAAIKPELQGNLFYGFAKSGISHYIESLRLELAKQVGNKVRVTDLRPEIVNTPENSALLDTQEKRDKAVQPEEIADWIVEHFDDSKLPPFHDFKTKDGFVLD